MPALIFINTRASVRMGKSPMLLPRAATGTAAVLLCLAVQGCSLFGIPNAVREGRLGGQSSTQIVYGLDASSGGLSVALDWFDPVTGKSGTCSRRDHTEASTAKGSQGVTYFVFDAPPGAYVVSPFNTTFGSYRIDLSTTGYRAEAGRQTFIGTFSMGSLEIPQRDLEQAKRDLGPMSSGMVLAEEVKPQNLQPMTVCSP